MATRLRGLSASLDEERQRQRRSAGARVQSIRAAASSAWNSAAKACGKGPQQKLNKDLCEAAAYGDADLVESLVAEGADPSHVSRQRAYAGLTALHIAAEAGNVGVCEWLVNQGAQVNAESRDARHYTPSMLASLAGHCDICELFLANGAQWKPQEANICLRAAAKALSLPMCTFLLETAGASAASSDANGTTPLHLVASYDDVRTSRIMSLATRRAQRDTERVTLAREGAKRRKLAKMLLAAGADANAADKDGCTPLYCCASHASLAAVLINAGADVNVHVGQDQETPLLKAAGSAASVKLLLTKGADPNARSYYGVVPLHRAAASQSRKAVSFLLQYGAKPNLKESMGRTALHYAAEELRRTNCATLLQHKKTNIDARDNEGNTALMVAVLQYRVSEKANKVLATGRFLLRRGADINITNHRGLDLEGLTEAYGIPIFDRLVDTTESSLPDEDGRSEFDDHSYADSASVISLSELAERRLGRVKASKHRG
ncbi:Ankyrin repeat domain-containing protein 50 [Hondaea fermentalgiana]|uniref:Ankyrin repeat domain-containing protein 50 n=1 Tax=Hondaea fermentalgiana TaxID=2315210 RepID=A0A2R5GQS7_9STRA|nr:Ankyrin repeat domain-containing protein 50 [Hondaea fermentalgiana]|eukprot:GBG32955.1 Ankyrin repeat domain-containing protein 50 [Hondaea fermentalgiana]